MKNNKIMRKCDITRIINNNNKIWANASKRERRVLLAKDVIAQINAGKVIPAQSTWISSSNGRQLVAGGGSVQRAIISGEIPKCECCALGGLMLSAIKYCNNVNAEEGEYFIGFTTHVTPNSQQVDDAATRLLYDVFDPRTVQATEAVYEMGIGQFTNISYMCLDDGYPENLRMLKSEDRMIAIMENIIENKGIFSVQKLFKKFA
jgi:hypothetical protein